MLKNIFVIFTLFAAVYCSGELSVISTPDSVLFKPSESTLKCSALGSILSASLGKSIVESSDFKNLCIEDPFNTPDHVIVMSLKGGNKINYRPLKTTSYSVTGNNCFTSIASTMERVEGDGASVLDLDLAHGLQTLEDNAHILGKLEVNIDNIKCGLSASERTQREALEQIAAVNAIAGALCTSIEAPALTHIHASFVSLIDDSKVYNEAVRCYVVEMGKLSEKVEETFGKTKVMVLSYATKEDEPRDEHKRSRRATESKDNEDLNLAKVYNDNYPVIFNIILWFGVVIAFSLYAISYAIATMDPGRDSIIYRMTSTRIKKDN